MACLRQCNTHEALLFVSHNGFCPSSVRSARRSYMPDTNPQDHRTPRCPTMQCVGVASPSSTCAHCPPTLCKWVSTQRTAIICGAIDSQAHQVLKVDIARQSTAVLTVALVNTGRERRKLGGDVAKYLKYPTRDVRATRLFAATHSAE